MIADWIILSIISVYIVLAGYIYIFQSRFVYYPDLVLPILSADPSHIGLLFENISFVTSDGVKLSGWFIPKDNPRGVLLFCHGNAGNIGHRLESIQLFNRLGLEIFIFDYRGYSLRGSLHNEDNTDISTCFIQKKEPIYISLIHIMKSSRYNHINIFRTYHMT